MSVSRIPVESPAFLQERMMAAREAGFCSSEAELVTDAIRTLLAARPDLRVATACQLYARGTVSLGRGAELAGLDVVRFKRTLHERGTTRTAPEASAETAEMARTGLRAAGRREQNAGYPSGYRFPQFVPQDRLLRLDHSLYQVEQAFIPAAVLRELAQRDLLRQLLAVPWISVWPEEPAPSDEGWPQDLGSEALGTGEQACIFLARSMADAVPLTGDNGARRNAQSQGIVVVKISAFFLACKMAGLVEPKQMARIIEDMKVKDFYESRAEVRELLLA